MRRRLNPAAASPAPKRVQMQWVDIDSIQEYERNPRNNEHAVEYVMQSISEFGFLGPIIVDADNKIIAGHTRHKAARRLQMRQVPIIKAEHLTDEQVQAFRIIDNKVGEAAGWNMDLLAQEITALSDSGIDWTAYGFTQEEIDCLGETVSDDCLSGGAAAETVSEGIVNRGPERTRVVIGEFVFYIPRDAYRQWSNEVKNSNDFEELRIIEDLENRLGMRQYLRTRVTS